VNSTFPLLTNRPSTQKHNLDEACQYIGRIVRRHELRLLDEVVVDPRIEESAMDLNDGAFNR